MTLVYDKGHVSRATQAQVANTALHYVTSLVPSQQAALLAEALPQLTPVTLPTGEVVQAYRTREPAHFGDAEHPDRLIVNAQIGAS